MQKLPIKARLLIAAVAVLGVVAAVNGLTGWQHVAYARFVAYLVVTALSARLRVSLPRITGSMSVNLPFILAALIELSLPEALVVAGVSALVQSLWPESKERNPIRILFNTCVILLAVRIAWAAVHVASQHAALGIILGGLAFLVVNTVSVAAIIGITEMQAITQVWQRIMHLTFPYYLLAAGIAALVRLADHALSWQIPLLMLPAMFMVYRSYSFYFRHMREFSLAGSRAMAASAGR